MGAERLRFCLKDAANKILAESANIPELAAIFGCDTPDYLAQTMADFARPESDGLVLATGNDDEVLWLEDRWVSGG